MELSRRTVILALVFGGAGAVAFPGTSHAADPPTMTPAEVLAAVRDGSLTLIDIRQPREWRATGLAEGAVPIDMRRPDFPQAVLAAANGGPVALICAGGVRSRYMQSALEKVGLGAVIDVPEGMMGSRAGPGWLRAGLPVVAWEP